jgi:hypothetical protein
LDLRGPFFGVTLLGHASNKQQDGTKKEKTAFKKSKKHGFIVNPNYLLRLNRLSTNSCLSKIKRSSIFSPTPMNFTGILNWLAMAKTIPP